MANELRYPDGPRGPVTLRPGLPAVYEGPSAKISIGGFVEAKAGIGWIMSVTLEKKAGYEWEWKRSEEGAKGKWTSDLSFEFAQHVFGGFAAFGVYGEIGTDFTVDDAKRFAGLS